LITTLMRQITTPTSIVSINFSLDILTPTTTTTTHTLSLHDALPISLANPPVTPRFKSVHAAPGRSPCISPSGRTLVCERRSKLRSEEHTSELQSHLNLVCRLLLEKKK